MEKFSLRKFNNILTVIIIGLSVYIIATPFMPYFGFWWDKLTDQSNGVRYKGKLAGEEGVNDGDLGEIPEENTLVIPDLQIDETIIEGEAPTTVDLGVWHRPHTSTPDKGSNTVIVAHRFSYTHGATFYHLDKLKAGEKFAIYWNQQEYVYEVYETDIVAPSAIEIEAPTQEPTVTLYTCTPIWTAENRLVVKAKLIDGPSDDQETETKEEA